MIGAMYCSPCQDNFESIVLDNGGRVCVPNKALSLIHKHVDGWEFVGSGKCADSTGSTEYNYCQYVDFTWSDMTGGIENCIGQGSLNVATLGTNFVGMYYKDGDRWGSDESLKPQCYFVFKNAADTAQSWIQGGRMFTRCTDGNTLPAKADMGDITQADGSEGHCYRRLPYATDDECAPTLANLNMPAATHIAPGGGDGRGKQRIGSNYYYCPPGTHWGGSGFNRCSPCTAEGHGASGNTHGGECRDKPLGIRNMIGAMYCSPCQDNFESIVLDNGGRVCVPNKALSLIHVRRSRLLALGEEMNVVESDICDGVRVNRVLDNPGFFTCDCVDANDNCLLNGDCMKEPKCPLMDNQVRSLHI